MKKILLPTDGSKIAGHALDIALDLAEKHDAQILLFHAMLQDKEPEELLKLQILADDQELSQELKVLSEGKKRSAPIEEVLSNPNLPEKFVPPELLQKIGDQILIHAQKACEKRNLASEILPVNEKPAAQGIVDMANNVNPDMIVLGMRGLRQIESMTFGSVSSDVCRSVSCRCIAVH